VPERPPDDPFADLGAEEAGRRRREAIGDALAERDRLAPEPLDRRPEVPRPGNKYAWVVGIVMLMGIAVLLFTTALPNSGEGLKGPERGERLKVFAAPSATGDLEGDANVRQQSGGSDAAGKVPACEVRSDEVVNLCALRERPMVLTFIFDRGAECYPQVDRVERMRGEFEDVNFVTVFFSRKDRDELREIVERRGWTQPVAVDADGAIVNLYGVGGCPITVFARQGGLVRETELGNLTEDQLRRKTERLLLSG
jgi:peroxiredoxin